MPAEVIGSRIIPDQGQEAIDIMDDYGTGFQLLVSVADSANRAALVAAAVAQQTANQTALEAYATAHGIDLSAQKAAGLLKKAKAKGVSNA